MAALALSLALLAYWGVLGLAVLSAISISTIGTSRNPAVLVEGFHDAFLGGAVFAVIGLIATLTLIRSSDSRAHVALATDAEPSAA